MKYFAIFFIVTLLFFSCERNVSPVNDELGVADKDVEKEDDFTGNDSDAADDSSGISDDEVQDFDETPIPLRNVTTEGSYGRIKISFEMNFADDLERKATLFFQGGCNGEISEQALIIEDTSSFRVAFHSSLKSLTTALLERQYSSIHPYFIILPPYNMLLLIINRV